MAKRLADIAQQIDNSSEAFETYLTQQLGSQLFDTLEKLTQQTEVFVFSGVIRNFFLHHQEIRDLDLVLVQPVDLTTFFPNHTISENSFGGYKILLDECSIDLWYAGDSWAYQYQKTLNVDLGKNMVQTAFFNFSAISYEWNTRTFHYTKEFQQFLRDKKIDVVHRPNKNLALCVVNSIYYAKKYQLQFKQRFATYLLYLHDSQKEAYQDAQKKHFGKSLYSNKEIDAFLMQLVPKPRKSASKKEDRNTLKISFPT